MAGLLDYFHTSLGGYNGLFAAIENFYAQLFFHFLYLHAERGLCYKTMLCCGGKMPPGVDGYDIFELYESQVINFIYKDKILIDRRLMSPVILPG
jgi:hypothetical protein